jgi:hypothetical protein
MKANAAVKLSARTQLTDVSSPKDANHKKHGDIPQILERMAPCLFCQKLMDMAHPWGRIGDDGVCGKPCQEGYDKRMQHDRMHLSGAELQAKYYRK